MLPIWTRAGFLIASSRRTWLMLPHECPIAVQPLISPSTETLILRLRHVLNRRPSVKCSVVIEKYAGATSPHDSAVKASLWNRITTGILPASGFAGAGLEWTTILDMT